MHRREVKTTMNQDAAIQEMIQVGRRLDQLGFVPSTDGNFSVRLSPREIVATVSGVKKGSLTPRDFVVIDPGGEILRGQGRVSTEIQMHLRIYGHRADVQAVVHSHPPTATGFAVAGLPLDACVLPEVVATIGAVPLAPYATPSTGQLPDSLVPFLDTHDAILLANHGAVTFGPTLFAAANRMETVEHFARILFVATLLGQVNRLSGAQVEELNAIRHRYGLSGRAAACQAADAPPTASAGKAAPAPAAPAASGAASAPPAPAVTAAPAPPGGSPEQEQLVERVLAEILRRIQPPAR